MKSGYLLGGGIEQGFGGGLSARVKYNYINTPDVKSTFAWDPSHRYRQPCAQGRGELPVLGLSFRQNRNESPRFLFWRVFFTRTGTHFARKRCSGIVKECPPDRAAAFTQLNGMVMLFSAASAAK
jgi:hypothetical protein